VGWIVYPERFLRTRKHRKMMAPKLMMEKKMTRLMMGMKKMERREKRSRWMKVKTK